MKLRVLLLIFFSLLTLGNSYSISTDNKGIPEQLRPWVDWVLGDNHDYNCPFAFNNSKERRCSWSPTLDLSINRKSGKFKQVWVVYKKINVTLPGDRTNWPLNVKVNGKEATVIKKHNKPTVQLLPGSYTIEGFFKWNISPEKIRIPNSSGLIDLTVNNKKIPFVKINSNGQLLLQSNSEKQKLTKSNFLKIKVYRKIKDSMPLTDTTLIRLEVGGLVRDELIGPVLLKNFIPINIESQLNVRLIPGNKLSVKLRPGSWSIRVKSRHKGKVTELENSKVNKRWGFELWSFEAQNGLRNVDITGVTPSDPKLFNLPSDWSRFPVYRMKNGSKLVFHENIRGNPNPGPDVLNLEKEIWYDFDGKGLTVLDKIKAEINKTWRMEISPEITLGRVGIDGQNQFITKTKQNELVGFEVRKGRSSIEAESRIESSSGLIPVIGWTSDFQSVKAKLNLPPGWTILATSGIDKVKGTWVKGWSLLLLFFVFLVTMAIVKLKSFKLGAISFLALVLITTETGAPIWTLIHIVFAMGLLTILPDSKFKKLVQSYRLIALLTLIIISFNFMVDQIKSGIHPAIKKKQRYTGMTKKLRTTIFSNEVTSEKSNSLLETSNFVTKKMSRGLKKAKIKFSGNQVQQDSIPKMIKLEELDPDAKVQTGPGLPNWNWNSFYFTWDGPVKKGHKMRLFLISPAINMFLAFIRVILLGALIYILSGVRRSDWPIYKKLINGSQSLLLLFVSIFSISLFAPKIAHALDFPGTELLKSLKERLINPPDCLPNCSSISKMNLVLSPKRLIIKMEVHALIETSVALPGNQKHWLPDSIIIDGKNAMNIIRTRSGELWIHPPVGKHQIILSGPLPSRDSIQIPFPQRPLHVSKLGKGWNVEGIRDNGIVEDGIVLQRIMKATKETDSSYDVSTLPPFVEVRRELKLGISWQVRTTIKRKSPRGTSIILSIPTLEGESVTTTGVNIKNGKVMVNMGRNANSFSWESQLKERSEIILKAPITSSWIERWSLEASTIWHIELAGIPVIQHQNINRKRNPMWRPWADEEVRIKISRPGGAGGQALTIQNASLKTRPGLRSSEVILNVMFDSSRGTKHTFTIPKNVEIQSVSINNKILSIRPKDNKLTLPLNIGKNNVKVVWNSDNGISTLFTTPKFNLGLNGVNFSTQIKVPSERWIFFLGGPKLGPAVLFWGKLIVLFLIVIILSISNYTPLKFHQWFLLSLGLTQISNAGTLIIFGFILVLGIRQSFCQKVSGLIHNLSQIALSIWFLLFGLFLYNALFNGLLGGPSMMIRGNGSNSTVLKWFADRFSAEGVPEAWLISIPQVYFRILMLLWAIWLAFSLIKWSSWAWSSFSYRGLWIKGPKETKKE